MWMAKKLKMITPGTLRGFARGSRNTFTVGNAHRRGRPRNGRRAGRPVTRADARPRRRPAGAGRPGDRPARARRRARPPPSHTWRGPSSLRPGRAWRAARPGRGSLRAARCFARRSVRRGRLPVPPAGVDGDQPGRARRCGDHLRPGVQRHSPAGTGSHQGARRNSRLNISGGRPAGSRPRKNR